MNTNKPINRDNLEERLAEHLADNEDARDLKRFFYEAQLEYAKNLNDADLLVLCKDFDIKEAI